MFVISAIVVHNSSKYPSTPSVPFTFTAWKNRHSCSNSSALIPYVFLVCMGNTYYDVKECNICLFLVESTGTVRCIASCGKFIELLMSFLYQ
jgi:hypothetical protein